MWVGAEFKQWYMTVGRSHSSNFTTSLSCLFPPCLYYAPRITSRQWSLFKSWLSGKWPMRRKPCFLSVPPAMSQRCMRSTPTQRRSGTVGWHIYGKLLKGSCIYMLKKSTNVYYYYLHFVDSFEFLLFFRNNIYRNITQFASSVPISTGFCPVPY